MRASPLLLSVLASQLVPCDGFLAPAPLARRPALRDAAALQVAAQLFEPQYSIQPRRSSKKRRSNRETVLAKTAAVAVAGGAIRSAVSGLAPAGALTLAAVLGIKLMPTIAAEAMLLAMALSVVGLWGYFPFNFIVFGIGCGGFFSVIVSSTASVQRWQRRRRAARDRRARRREPELDEAVTLALRQEQEPEPSTLVLLVVASLLFSVVGALP